MHDHLLLIYLWMMLTAPFRYGPIRTPCPDQCPRSTHGHDILQGRSALDLLFPIRGLLVGRSMECKTGLLSTSGPTSNYQVGSRGLHLYKPHGKTMDATQFVVITDSENEGKFKTVVLDGIRSLEKSGCHKQTSLLAAWPKASRVRTESRPGKRILCIYNI